MKITDYKTFVVGTPPPHIGGRWWVFVKLVADDGSHGWGEVYGAPFNPHLVTAMVGDVVERHAIGHRPFDIERLWRTVYSRGYTQTPDATLVAVLSGVEIACWDLIGKATSQPVHNLLGGKLRERLRTYTYIYPEPGDTGDVYSEPDLAAARAAEYVRRGFTAVKFDPVGPYTAYDPRQLSLEMLDHSEAFARRLREAVGDKADLLFGTHGQMTPAGALRLAKRLERYDPLWFEEPVPAERPAEMALVARGTSIPIATGERLATTYAFPDVLHHQAAAILQPALGRVGGLLEAKKIAGMAEAHYVQMAPHMYCGPISGIADVQLSACTPNFLIQESLLDWGRFHSEILVAPPRFEEDHIFPTEAPGIGLELDEAVLEANPFQGNGLHLEVSEVPL